MADIKSKQERSWNMSQIGNKNTKPEEIVRHFLFSQGFRYRKNDKRFPGTPDIVLPRYRSVVFVHGCFWHRHPGCKKASIPTSNVTFWNTKFQNNIDRDSKTQQLLKEMGWHVVVVWECELSSKFKREERLTALAEEIRRNGRDGCIGDKTNPSSEQNAPIF